QMRQIEGVVYDDREIILVDDLMNSGSSFLKQVKILEEERGLKVKAIFCIVKFRDGDFYDVFKERGITVHSIFNMADLNARECKAGQKKFTDPEPVYVAHNKTAHLLEQGPKNLPVLSGDTLITFSDDGTACARALSTHRDLWHTRLVSRVDPMYNTFKYSLNHKNRVYTQTYHGALAEVRTDGTNARQTILHNTFSTPLYAFENDIIYGANDGIGTETAGMYRFNPKTRTSERLLVLDDIAPHLVVDTHTDTIFVTDKNNHIYCLDGSGTIRWHKLLSGKNTTGLVRNGTETLLAIATDGTTQELQISNGTPLDTFELPDFQADIPILSGGILYGTSLSREIYAYDIASKTYKWRLGTSSRMYSRPTVCTGKVFVGDNDGVVRILDCITGTELRRLQFPERITNPVLVTDAYIIVETFGG
ncbi:MAG: PQQ-binding-like beta-propeller repeat protein, partial [Bacteroidota bacterium]